LEKRFDLNGMIIDDMLIIGCDFHTRCQQVAVANDETGELLLDGNNWRVKKCAPNFTVRWPSHSAEKPRYLNSC